MLSRRRIAAGLCAAVLAAVGSLALLAGGTAGAATTPDAASGSVDTAKAKSVATLVIIDPGASIRREGKTAFKPAKDGAKLGVGDTIQTDATGFVEVQYTDDSYSRLDANTTFTLISLTDDEGNRQVKGSIESGQAWNRTSALTESESFEQQGAGATAAVVGTAFNVECTDATHCIFTALDHNTSLEGVDGVIKLLTPLDQCDSTNGALCADITKLDPSELPAWLLKNLILDVERGFPLPDYPVTFTLTVENGTVRATKPQPAVAPACGTPGQAPAIVYDGSPGTNAPPSALGTCTMTAFGVDNRPTSTNVTYVTAPGGGDVTFSVPLEHLKVGSGWATWSHGYTGDVYWIPNSSQVTLTLPANTYAFSFYGEPDNHAIFVVTATANDGTTSGPVSVDGDGGAQYFGFYSTSSSAPLVSVTVSTSDSDGMAIGEFTIAQTPGVTTSEAPPEDPPDPAPEVTPDPSE
jgi:hypothetical protein